MTAIEGVSQTFDPDAWDDVAGFEDLTDLTYHRAQAPTGPCGSPSTGPTCSTRSGRTRSTSCCGCWSTRARPATWAACCSPATGRRRKNGKWAFCTGGDQRIRGRTGYQYAEGETAESVDPARFGRLHILECQRLIRFMPKVVICLVNGWAAGGGHSLHVICDLTLASAEEARFKQTDADVGSFDGGYGSAYLARQVGQKLAREIFFLGQEYSAEDGVRMGVVNRAVPHAELEATGLEWGRIVNGKSPQAQRMLKYAFNLPDDGLVGQQLFAGEATRMAYMTDEAVEGRDQFLEKREPDWSRFPWMY